MLQHDVFDGKKERPVRERGRMLAASLSAAAALLLFTGAGVALEATQKPRIAPPCRQCHRPEENILRGTLVSAAKKAGLIQMQVGSATWLVRFDDDTKLVGVERLSQISREREAAVTVTRKGGDLYASIISVKPAIKVPEEKIIRLDELARFVAAGPEAGNFTLIDSRPAQIFNDGHIPGAVSVPDAEFDRYAGRLPKERDRLLIFYCSGPTCRMSTSSAARAERLGYRNIKIFTDGMPAWRKAGNLVLSTVDDLRFDIDKDNPFILVDVRSVEEARKGHIFGSVSIPGKELAQARDKFPPDRSAPIVLYDNDTKSTADEFRIIRSWGYPNVSVLDGGIESWKKAGGLVVIGDVSSKISYAPKPRPGEISIEEFRKIADALPADKILLDVRDADEARQGMLRDAVNIPAGEMREGMKDIPKDKEVIVYCSTGVRSEMMYHMLKEAGYRARFLNAQIRIDREGRFTVARD